MLNVSNRNTRKTCEICSTLILGTLQRHHSGVFLNVNFENISKLFLCFYYQLWTCKFNLGKSRPEVAVHRFSPEKLYWKIFGENSQENTCHWNISSLKNSVSITGFFLWFLQKIFRTAAPYNISGRNFPKSRFFSKRNIPICITSKTESTSYINTNNYNCPSKYHVRYHRRIQNPVNHLKWSVLQK